MSATETSAPPEFIPSVKELKEAHERITPDEVLQAYKKTGMHPCRGMLFFTDTKACALGTIRLSRGLTREQSRLQHSSNYETTFAAGFDGSSPGFWGVTQGYKDGASAYKAVKKVFKGDW